MWNEPDNKSGNYKADATNKTALVAAFLPKVFTYARAAIPDQPLTSGLWQGDWSSPDKLSAVEKIQIENSDVISFHNYDKPEDFEKHVVWLEAWHRPILCTEYMARPRGSTFQAILPVAKKHHVAAINWGFVAGKTQTYLPWIRGSILTLTSNPKSGSTTSSTPTVRHTQWRRSKPSAPPPSGRPIRARHPRLGTNSRKSEV